MSISTRSRRLAGYALAATLAASAPGCFQQDNNAEFMRTAPAAPPTDHPNDTVAERRARGWRPSPGQKRAEAGAKAKATKAKGQVPAFD